MQKRYSCGTHWTGRTVGPGPQTGVQELTVAQAGRKDGHRRHARCPDTLIGQDLPSTTTVASVSSRDSDGGCSPHSQHHPLGNRPEEGQHANSSGHVPCAFTNPRGSGVIPISQVRNQITKSCILSARL